MKYQKDEKLSKIFLLIIILQNISPYCYSCSISLLLLTRNSHRFIYIYILPRDANELIPRPSRGIFSSFCRQKVQSRKSRENDGPRVKLRVIRKRWGISIARSWPPCIRDFTETGAKGSKEVSMTRRRRS